MQLIQEFTLTTFAIIKHTNVCGVAQRPAIKESWDAALAGDPESAFVEYWYVTALLTNQPRKQSVKYSFEVLIAPSFDEDALTILKSKKNRILLKLKAQPENTEQYKSVLNGVLIQGIDKGNFAEWKEVGGRETNSSLPYEREDLAFANIICKHLKSNAIALVKNKQLIGKGCGQTSRIDSLRQAIEKSKQFNFDLHGAVLASDAFFPFNDLL
ncbi:MAG: hypothetical protein WDO19_11020 [Bacteroidota bacterium]